MAASVPRDLASEKTQVFIRTEKTPAGKPPRMELVAGSQPDFSSEINDLLRDRLRLASLLLFVGYLTFFIKGLFLPPATSSWIDVVLSWMLACVTAIAGIVAWRLCVQCTHVLNHLRWVESLVFVSSALLFLVGGYAATLSAAEHGYLPPVGVPWLILIFTYALYIPNTWQRAAVRIIPLALAPPLTLIAAKMASPNVAELMESSDSFHYVLLESVMLMGFASTIAIWGVKTIRTLRTQVYEAKRMGQYRLKCLLGRGGMGEVYLAEHVMLKRPCAIKLIRPEKAGDPGTLARFEQEVQLTAKLTHWNSVEIFDYGRADDGTFYYVMEYLPGMNLDQLVEMHGPMPASRVIHLLVQTCDALAEAHAQGMVHRDIKPQNIFAARRGGKDDVAKLLDFGLVRSLDRDSDTRLTQEGAVTGSPLYLSPEQASGDLADPRSDIYSLGCVAYYLLTGHAPFEGMKTIKLIIAHMQEVPAAPSTHNPNIPADLEAIVLRSLEKNPRDRFQTVTELQEALLSCEAAGEWTQERAAAWWREYGCPRKKELDRCICSGGGIEDDQAAVAITAGELVGM